MHDALIAVIVLEELEKNLNGDLLKENTQGRVVFIGQEDHDQVSNFLSQLKIHCFLWCNFGNIGIIKYL